MKGAEVVEDEGGLGEVRYHMFLVQPSYSIDAGFCR